MYQWVGADPPGEKIASIALVIWLELLVFAAWAYWMSIGCPSTTRGVAAFLIAAIGALAAHDGYTLAVREEARAHDGRVTAGVVVNKIRSPGADSSRTIATRWSYGELIPTAEGFKIHDELARIILTGSPTAWVIDYRYACEVPRGCSDRDFVTEALWRRLQAGQHVNVLRANGETGSSRLDENPMWGTAIVDLSIAGALLVVASIVSGRLPVLRRRVYLTAPAVVTAVEPVKYRDVTRWRIRFAYVDPQGAAQESADEVLTAAWKPGDDCLAVFRPEQPGLATFRPLHAG